MFPTTQSAVLLRGKASRKTRGALSSSIGGARGDPIGGSQFVADRRPGVSHIMVACLPVGRDVQTFGGRGGAVVAAETTGSAVGSRSEEVRLKVLLQAGAEDGSMAPHEARAGQDYRSVGGRDFCVVVSGGLASVLELVQPLRHVGWAGRDAVAETAAAARHGAGKKREILRMARMPSTWRRAVAIGDCKAADDEHSAEALVDDVDSEAEEFMVMCEDGWFGWYQSHHRRFEVSTVGLARRPTILFGMVVLIACALLAM